MDLGRLNEVDLRNAWKHEATDFTSWLAEKENLDVLSEEIGINISLLQTEASVGKFNVDILAEEENTGRKIIIENQLEVTDHDHLGKIITYASGYDAEIIVWIVKDVRDEHKQAIDWLNEHTDENTNFFAIKMELWQIGNSPPAPKFHIISQPNDWAKTIKSSSGPGKLTETKLLQKEFWDAVKEEVKTNAKKLRATKTYPQHWYSFSMGSSDAYISMTMNTQVGQIACEVWIADKKELFYDLEKKKDMLENKFGEQLEWMELQGKKASRIKISKEADVNDRGTWAESVRWLVNKAEKFHEVFGKEVKK